MKFNKTLVFIFITAFLVRFIALNQSLWLDEATTARVVQQFGFLEILTKFSPHDFHPPLFYWLIKLWTDVFGYSEIALRMPSVIFSLLTGCFVYKIARLLNPASPSGLRGARWSAVFFLFNPLIIYYSQEGRMYMMATFFLTTGLYYFIKCCVLNGLKGYGLKNQILFGIFSLIAFLTFYGTVFLIIPMLGYLVYKKEYKVFFISSIILLFSFLLITPLLYQQLLNAKISLGSVANWPSVLGKANIKNLLLIPIKFSIGRIDFYPKWLYYLIAGIWTIIVWFLILIQKSKLRSQNFKLKVKCLLYLLITPLVLGFMVSFITPLLQYFRFIFLIPIMSILLSFSASDGSHIHPTGVILVTGFLIFSLVYLLMPRFYREDWKSLVAGLPQNKPVYMIKSSGDPVYYYRNYQPIVDLRELTSLRVNVLNKEITVIPYTSDIYGFDYKKILSGKGYYLVHEKVFRGVILENWQKR